MSLHAQLSPEALAILRARQRNSTISSIIIALLVVVLVGVLLLLILLPSVDNFTPEIVSYQSGVEEENKVKKKIMNHAVERKPSSPSSSMARVIASNSVSNIAIPVPDETVPTESVDFGNGEDFGDGWGDGDGWGTGGGATFFGDSIGGDRILYVIDYSASMNGDRQRLMRVELAKSVMHLSAGKKFQLIFFAGPAWVAGNDLKMQGKKGAVVKGKGGHKFDWKCGGGAGGWSTAGKVQKPEWLDATDSVVKKSDKLIKSHRLIWGTNWENPLAMAFRMDPLPNAIIFMTDGLAPGNPEAVAEKYGKLARKNGVVINAIALMEPKAAKAMEALSRGSGGKFSLIGANGKKVDPKKAPKKAPKKPAPKGKGKKKK